MDVLNFMPFMATVITLLFAGSVFLRYFKRKGLHLLLWGLGLMLFAAGTFSETYLSLRWSPFALHVWYLSGAMLTAAWLGQGTIYLLVRKPGAAHVLTAVLAVLSVVALVGVFSAPLHAAAFTLGVPISSQYKSILTRSSLIVMLTIVLNLYGTLGLVGGAVWSAWLFWRKRVLPNRVVGNILIALGGLLPAGAGTLIKLGFSDWLYLSELLGVAIMFAGFWLATQPQPMEESESAPATAGV